MSIGSVGSVGCVLAVLASGIAAEHVAAAPILVNIGSIAAEAGLDVTATGVADSDGVLTNWNTITSAAGVAAGSVIDSDGHVASGVSITTNSISYVSSSNSGQYAAGGSVADWIDLDAIEKYGATSGSGDVVFSGLTGSAYKIEFVSARNSSHRADYTVHGLFADSTPNGDDFTNAEGWQNGAVLTWNSVAPIGGTITLNGTKIVSFAYFSAIRLTEIPEPATLMLLGLGGLMVVHRRKI